MDDKTLAGRVGSLESSQRAIHDALLGTPDVQIDGSVVRADDGMVAKLSALEVLPEKVSSLEALLVNGGIKVRIPKTVWAAIGAAIISGVAQIVAAVV